MPEPLKRTNLSAAGAPGAAAPCIGPVARCFGPADLQAAAEDRLDDVLMVAVEEHVVTCAACLRAFDQIRRGIYFSDQTMGDEERAFAELLQGSGAAAGGEPTAGNRAPASPVAGPGRIGREALVGTLVGNEVLYADAGATYRIVKLADGGLERFCETYEAVIAEPAPIADLGRSVTLRLAHITSDMSPDAARSRLEQLNPLFDAEMRSLERLGETRRAAQLRDGGTYTRSGGLSRRFYVQTSGGVPFQVFLAATYPGGGGRFTIPTAQAFYELVRELAKTLCHVHACNVVHGHIWPGSIRMMSLEGSSGNSMPTPVLIDFGQPLVSQALDDPTPAVYHRSHAYRNPERRCSFVGDVYSLGCVLFYLATGDDPPPAPPDDYQALRTQIAAAVQSANQQLYNDDRSVVDVIAQCLRSQPALRLSSAMTLVHLADTFLSEPSGLSVHKATSALVETAQEMDRHCGTFFKNIAIQRAQEMRLTLKSLVERECIDIFGDPEQIRYMGTAFMSPMGPGSQYLSVASPRFWWPNNIGTDGLFLSMTKRAARRGANVQRVFLLDAASFKDPWLPDIMRAQRRIVQELGEPDNYRVKFRVLDPAEEQLAPGEERYFALFISENEQIAMYPSYMENGQLHSLHFRNEETQVDVLRQQFERFMKDSQELSDFEVALESMKKRSGNS
jgi:hypothetical protein